MCTYDFGRSDHLRRHQRGHAAASLPSHVACTTGAGSGCAATTTTSDDINDRRAAARWWIVSNTDTTLRKSAESETRGGTATDFSADSGEHPRRLIKVVSIRRRGMLCTSPYSPTGQQWECELDLLLQESDRDDNHDLADGTSDLQLQLDDDELLELADLEGFEWAEIATEPLDDRASSGQIEDSGADDAVPDRSKEPVQCGVRATRMCNRARVSTTVSFALSHWQTKVMRQVICGCASARLVVSLFTRAVY